ncbi:MAG: hypothetical protein IH899_18500 [Planctomycetes bacterium]|nr:hypothetical protein [Planctomycetota bacterium]
MRHRICGPDRGSRDAIDEFREQFTWAVQNERLSPAACPVLKRMAADPTAADWSARLEIVRGSTDKNSRPDDPQIEQPVFDRLLHDAEELVLKLRELHTILSAGLYSTNSSSAEGGAKTKASLEEIPSQNVPGNAPEADPPSIVVIRGGDPVEFVLDGHEYFGEILQVDEAAGSADVCIVPTMECVTVDLSTLQSVPDDDDESLFDDSPESDPTTEAGSSANEIDTPNNACERLEHRHSLADDVVEPDKTWDELIERLETGFSAIATQQLELILTALDNMKRELIEVMHADHVPGAPKADSGQKSLFDEVSTHLDS